MKKQHQFTSFSLFRAPGFPSHTFPDLARLHAGLNVVYGPNGVGKSTLVRTMRSLLFSSDVQKHLEAEALLLSGNQQWHLSLSQGKLVQKLLATGDESRIPGRNDEYADAYWFPLHELLDAEGSQSVFLQAIERQMQGGVDLQLAIERAEGRAAFSNGKLALSRKVREAKEAYESKRSDIEANGSLKSDITCLEKELSQQPVLMQQYARLQGVQTCLQILEKQRNLLSVLASYDGRLAQMDEHTLDEAKTLHSALDQAQQSVSECCSVIKADQEALDSLNLDAEFEHNPKVCTIIKARIDALKELETQMRSAQKEAGDAASVLHAFEEQLTWLVAQAPAAADLQQMVARLTKLAHACEPLRCNLAAAQTLVGQLGEEIALDPKEKPRLEELRTTLLLSLDTLGKLKATQRTKPRSKMLLIVGACALSALGAILGMAVSPLAGLSGTVLIALFLGFITREKPDETYLSLQQQLGTYQDRLEKQKGDFFLESFDFAGVASLLATVVARLAELQALQSGNERIRKARQTHQEAKDAYDTWLQQWKHASEALHLTEEPDLQGSQFFNVSSILKDWLTAYSKDEQARGRLQEVSAQLQASAVELAALCKLSGTKPVDLIAEASLLVTDIQHADSLHVRLAAQKELLDREEKRKEEAAAALQALYDRLNLELGDMHSLQGLQNQFKEYRELGDTKRAIEQQLASYPVAVKEEAAQTTAGDVAVALAEKEQALAAMSEQSERLGGMRQRFESLGSDTKLEEALFTYEEAVQALEAQRRKEVQDRMVFSLFEEVKQQSQSTYVPQVVQRAGNWLLRITANRFSLGMGQGTFTAVDTTLGRSFSLSELSSGTRVQLLFAVRMAFLEMLESGSDYHFPLFFDELMANSDDQRSLAIAQAIVQISKDRQVFYCTAQMDEVTKLTDVAQNELQVIRLEDEKRSYRIQESPFSSVKVETPSVIEPVQDYAGYAKALGISSPQLHEPIGSLSSWYVCTDSRQLYAHMRRGFAEAGQAARTGDPYQQRFSLLSEAQALAQAGRPKVLTVHDLGDDDLKLNRTAAYYEALQAFVQEQRRTGNDVLQAIDARILKGFRDPAKDALSSFLYEQGFATDAAPYTVAEILNRLCLGHPDLQVDSDDYRIVQRYLMSLDLQN